MDLQRLLLRVPGLLHLFLFLLLFLLPAVLLLGLSEAATRVQVGHGAREAGWPLAQWPARPRVQAWDLASYCASVSLGNGPPRASGPRGFKAAGPALRGEGRRGRELLRSQH